MRPLLFLTAGLILVAPAASADRTADGVREAVAARRVRDSDLKGARDARTPYRDLAADGGVLVGLEIGLGGSGPDAQVLAIRPIYRIGGRDRFGPPAGSFLSDEVKRSVRLVAPERYAVAAVRVSAGKHLAGLGLRFARIDGAWLKPADATESDWVGAAAADNREWLDGEGRPVVGLFARLDGTAVRGLGLTFADVPPPAVPMTRTSPATGPAPAPAPPAPTHAAPASGPPADSPSASSASIVFVVVALAIVVPLLVVGGLVVRRSYRRQNGYDRWAALNRLPTAHRRPAGPARRPALTDILETGTDGWK